MIFACHWPRNENFGSLSCKSEFLIPSSFLNLAVQRISCMMWKHNTLLSGTLWKAPFVIDWRSQSQTEPGTVCPSGVPEGHVATSTPCYKPLSVLAGNTHLLPRWITGWQKDYLALMPLPTWLKDEQTLCGWNGWLHWELEVHLARSAQRWITWCCSLVVSTRRG